MISYAMAYGYAMGYGLCHGNDAYGYAMANAILLMMVWILDYLKNIQENLVLVTVNCFIFTC